MLRYVLLPYRDLYAILFDLVVQFKLKQKFHSLRFGDIVGITLVTLVAFLSYIYIFRLRGEDFSLIFLVVIVLCLMFLALLLSGTMYLANRIYPRQPADYLSFLNIVLIVLVAFLPVRLFLLIFSEHLWGGLSEFIFRFSEFLCIVALMQGNRRILDLDLFRFVLYLLPCALVFIIIIASLVVSSYLILLVITSTSPTWTEAILSFASLSIEFAIYFAIVL